MQGRTLGCWPRHAERHWHIAAPPSQQTKCTARAPTAVATCPMQTSQWRSRHRSRAGRFCPSWGGCWTCCRRAAPSRAVCCASLRCALCRGALPTSLLLAAPGCKAAVERLFHGLPTALPCAAAWRDGACSAEASVHSAAHMISCSLPRAWLQAKYLIVRLHRLLGDSKRHPPPFTDSLQAPSGRGAGACQVSRPGGS